MKFFNIFIYFIVILLISGCAVKEQTVKIKKELPVKIEQKDEVIFEEKVKISLPYTKNQSEFLEILKEDKYASLCANKKFEELKNIAEISSATILLDELFFDYANNLANSCIDLDLFSNELKSKNAVENKMHYEYYLTDINREKLIKDFKDENKSVKDILEKYLPKHPDFFGLIEKLKDEELSENDRYKLRLNIERLKLLKYSNSDNFIQLNVPSVNFSFFENGKNIKSFGTVVGEYETQTPILSSKLTYFVINPTWNIPDSIAKSTIIPNALKDKNYLKKKNIVIRKNYKLDSQKINFNKVNWKAYLKTNVKYIPYKFIQLPSKTNGMGRIKFMFPNEYAVYMHDTIGTWRFQSSKEKIRFNSHGCVRLEHPLGFMKYISANYTKYSYSHTRSIYDKFKTENISLNKKLPVHITYQTCQIKNGKLKFYKDIYGYDELQKLNF